MPKGHYCFRCKKNFPNKEGTLCEDSNGRPLILCGGCYIMESIKVIQKKIDAIKINPSLISLDTRLDMSIAKLSLEVTLAGITNENSKCS